MRRNRGKASRGFTLIELMIVSAIAGILVSAGVATFGSWSATQRAKNTARQIQNLMLVARAEAIRTGVNHIAYFNNDPSTADLFLEDGTTRVVALLVQDTNGNGRPDSGEVRHHVPQVPAGTEVSYGRTLATTLVPNATGARMGDPFDETSVEGSASEIASAGNFRHPASSTTVQTWVLFAPDGTPRSVVPNGATVSTGAVGSGDGAVYVTNGVDDYAVVLAPLGGTRMYRWSSQDTEWR